MSNFTNLSQKTKRLSVQFARKRQKTLQAFGAVVALLAAMVGIASGIIVTKEIVMPIVENATVVASGVRGRQGTVPWKHTDSSLANNNANNNNNNNPNSDNHHVGFQGGAHSMPANFDNTVTNAQDTAQNIHNRLSPPQSQRVKDSDASPTVAVNSSASSHGSVTPGNGHTVFVSSTASSSGVANPGHISTPVSHIANTHTSPITPGQARAKPVGTFKTQAPPAQQQAASTTSSKPTSVSVSSSAPATATTTNPRTTTPVTTRRLPPTRTQAVKPAPAVSKPAPKPTPKPAPKPVVTTRRTSPPQTHYTPKPKPKPSYRRPAKRSYSRPTTVRRSYRPRTRTSYRSSRYSRYGRY